MGNEYETNFEKRMDEQQKSMFPPREVNVGREMIYLLPKQEKEIMKILSFLKHGEEFGTELGYRGVLLTGPPGCGKTLAAQYIATEAGLDYVPVKGIPSPEHIQSLFAELRGRAKDKGQLAVFDEIDRYSSREEIDQGNPAVLSSLLEEIQGIEPNDNILCIGMTNMPERLDTAMRRQKRFGKEIEFLPPDYDGRLEILRIHAYLKSRKSVDEEGIKGHSFNFREKDLEMIAESIFGHTGDDVYGLLTEAGVIASLEDRKDVNYDDLLQAKECIRLSALKDMPVKKPVKRFDDFGGIENHEDLAKLVIGDGFNAEKEGPRFLFYGDSGCGKSSFAEAIAEHYGFNLLMIEGSSLINSLVGKTGKDLEKTIRRAELTAPSVLLFDEFDSFVQTKGYQGFKDTWTGRMRSRLADPLKGVILIATVSDPSRLQKETLRRFDYQFRFSMPSEEQLRKIWAVHLRRISADGIDTGYLAGISGGMTGSQVEMIRRRIERYSITPTKEVIRHMIENEKNRGKDDEIDHVAEFMEIKKFMR